MVVIATPFEKISPKLLAARCESISQLGKFKTAELFLVPVPGEWSGLDIAHHVSEIDIWALGQLHTIQAKKNPRIAMPDEAGPHRRGPSKLPASLKAGLARMATQRQTSLFHSA